MVDDAAVDEARDSAADERTGPLLRFSPGTQVARDDPAQLTVRRGSFRLTLEGLGGGALDALRVLEGEGATEAGLAERARRDGALALLRFHQVLDDLDGCSLLTRVAPIAGRPLVTYEPFVCPGPRRLSARAPEGKLAVSRFSLLRRGDGVLAMESPLAFGALRPHGPEGAALLGRLMERPFDREDVRRWVRASRPDADDPHDAILDLLWQAGFLTELDADGQTAEDRDPALQQWESHDLLFHARSRAGRHDAPYGSTYPFRGRVDPLPAVAEADPGATWIELARPDLEHIETHDPPFTHVLESRRSQREPAVRPVTKDQLGELLYRSARIRSLDTSGEAETSRRVYPGGGALYELEIHPVVRRCQDLDQGIYRYDPSGHGLRLVAGAGDESRALLKAAGQTAQAPAPDVLLVFTARFQRITWKYRSMSYAGILKNLGVLYQTIYLVATAMGLRVCALGGGKADLFARATGLDYAIESSVGEMIVNGSGD